MDTKRELSKWRIWNTDRLFNGKMNIHIETQEFDDGCAFTLSLTRKEIELVKSFFDNILYDWEKRSINNGL